MKAFVKFLAVMALLFLLVMFGIAFIPTLMS